MDRGYVTTPPVIVAAPGITSAGLTGTASLLCKQLLRLLMASTTVAATVSSASSIDPNHYVHTVSGDLPLVPMRKLNYSVASGTWMSLDVSPDGRVIVFDLVGDLYLLPVGGGRATRITSGSAIDAEPKFSPDGSRIVFVSDRSGDMNLWIANSDGSGARPLTRERRTRFVSPIWSPDGVMIVVSRKHPRFEARSQLWTYDIRSGRSRPIGPPGAASNLAIDRPGGALNVAQVSALGPALSRDGKFVYYSRGPAGQNWGAALPLWQVARRELGSDDEEIITRANGGGMRPVLSPDGRWLVYGSRSEGETGLRLLNLHTGQDRWLVYPTQRDNQETYPPDANLLPGSSFTPDGAALITSWGGHLRRVPVVGGKVTTIPMLVDVSLDVGPDLHFERRVDDGPTVTARLIQSPTYSPDGNSVAFSALGDIYMKHGRGKVRRLAHHMPYGEAAAQPVWSPDGKALAYTTFSVEGGRLYSLSISGRATPKPLTPIGPSYRDPVWAPDGTAVIALRASRDAWRKRQAPYIDWTPRRTDGFWRDAGKCGRGGLEAA